MDEDIVSAPEPTVSDAASPVEVDTDYKAKYESLSTQYKGVQRELERTRRNGADQTALHERLDVIVDDMAVLRQALISGDFIDGEARDRITQTQARRSVDNEFRSRATEQAEMIQEALDGADLDWITAPELERARTLWKQGAVDGRDLVALRDAARETIKAVKAKSKPAPAPSPESRKPATRADLKESSTPKPSAISLESVRLMSPEERLSRWDEIQKAVYGV